MHSLEEMLMRYSFAANQIILVQPNVNIHNSCIPPLHAANKCNIIFRNIGIFCYTARRIPRPSSGLLMNLPCIGDRNYPLYIFPDKTRVEINRISTL